MTIVATANFNGTNLYFHEVEGSPDNAYTHYYGVTKEPDTIPGCVFSSLGGAVKSVGGPGSGYLHRTSLRLKDASQVFYPRLKA